MTLTAADDRRHPAEHPRDSLFWQVTLPDERIAAQLYLPIGRRLAGWNLAVWGEGVGDPVVDLGSAEPDADADLDDLLLDGGDAGQVRVRHKEPLRSVTISAHTPRIALEAEFTSRHRAVSYREGPQPIPAWFALDRFEQTGRLVGTLRIAGHELRLDAAAHRDHSWGRRDWRMPQHWTWFVAYAGDRSVNGWIWIAAGAWGFAGYVADGDRVVPVERIEHRLRFGAGYDQEGLDAIVIDVEGRRTRVELESFGILRLPDPRSGSEVREAACHARIDGATGAGQLECEWPIDYLRHLGA